MGKIKKVQNVKLFVGMLSSLTSEVFDQACEEMVREFGPIDSQSPILSFGFTGYYDEEMGKPLKRKFISFQNLIDPENLKKYKIYSNNLEEKFQGRYSFPSRPLNLDPGYLSLSKVILATTKDYSHRIYLGDGIYAECTLHYSQKSYRHWEWTYPDYQTPEYLDFFCQLREVYRCQLKSIAD